MEAYRVSPANLGHVEDVNRANNKAQEDRLHTEIIIPRLERWKKLLNTKLLPKFGGAAVGYEFDYDTPLVPDLQEEADIDRKRALSAASFVREGFDPAAVLETFGFPPMAFVGPPSVLYQEDEPVQVDV